MSDDVGDHISPAGLAALEAELERLEGEGRREMAQRLKYARELGDLKENAEYHDAKDAQAHLETRILRLRERRQNAVVVQPGADAGVVELGTTVTVRDAESGREGVHTLVSATESAPAQGRLSIDSPLGRALAGAREGDEVAFVAPRGERRLRIVEVRAP